VASQFKYVWVIRDYWTGAPIMVFRDEAAALKYVQGTDRIVDQTPMKQ
jgi:hypothetical protein